MGRTGIWVAAIFAAWATVAAGAPMDAPAMGPTTPTLTADEAFPGARRVSGTVFWDANENRRRDPGEAGVAGARLNAGLRTATAGADGAYVLESPDPFFTIAVSFPSGSWPTGPWFRRPAKSIEEHLDFGLRKETPALPFVFVHFTDPHTGLPQAVDNIQAECAALPVRPRFYLCSGDLRSQTVSVTELDKLRSDFGMMHDAFARMKAPVFVVPGNHDVVDLKSNVRFPPEIAEHPLFGQRAWEKWVGPANWSFQCGGVLFIGQPWAEYTATGWDSFSPAIKKWAADEVAAAPSGTRVVLLCHAGGVTEADWILSGHSHAQGPSYGRANRLAGGQSGRHYTREEWNKDNERRAEAPFVEPVPVRNDPQHLRRFGEDGCPSGYRLVAVYPDRMDTFYKVIGEPRTIMVNSPRRHRPVTVTSGALTLEGQVFDPQGDLQSVSVTVAGRPAKAQTRRSLLWTDVTARVEGLDDLADGCYDITVLAQWPDGAFELSEKYLLLTGREQPFAGRAVRIEGSVYRLSQPVRLRINGVDVGPAIQPSDRQFAVEVPAGLAKKLNRVDVVAAARPESASEPVKGIASLSNVRMIAGDAMFLDQRLTSGFGMGRMLRPDQPVYIDLAVAGKVTPWQVRKTAPRP